MGGGMGGARVRVGEEWGKASPPQSPGRLPFVAMEAGKVWT